jgi:hypothetical protein
MSGTVRRWDTAIVVASGAPDRAKIGLSLGMSGADTSVVNTMYVPGPAPLPAYQRRGRELRGLWGTLTVIFLLAVGFTYGATRYQQRQFEEDATRDARKLAVRVLQPMLLPSDASGPVRGERYQQLLSIVEERVMAGPINRVRVWRADGTILFADDPSVVGKREPQMRDEIHAVTGSGTSQGSVKGERYRSLTSVRVGDPPRFLVVELDQPHDGIVQRAKKQWRPWMVRAGIGAGVSFVLYLATAIGFALYGALVKSGRAKPKQAKPKDAKAKDAKAKDAKAQATPAVAKNGKEGKRGGDKDGELPGYMQPGFQDEVNARRRAEDAMQTLERQRDELLERVRRLEAELEQARGGNGASSPVGAKTRSTAPRS